MYAQLSFFLLLVGLSLVVLGYKTVTVRLPWVAISWWPYSFTAILIAVAAWMFMYGEDWRKPFILFVLDYGFFLLIRRGTLPRWLGVILTLVPLLLVKASLQPFFSILGLSFITFRAIDALLMQRPEDSADIGEYFLYLFFPPAILAGPMYRWHVFREDISGAYARLSLANIVSGWEYLLLGIVQKFCFAQIIDVCVLQRVSPDDYSPAGIAANAFGYTAFLYFDFAGYSNMAIGAAGLFGFRLPDNFKNPIASSNPQDFWKRWHVSLSEWLRDVVFSPLYKYLVSKGGLANHKIQAQNICILATLFVMGTWNGLQPRYICSGLMFGAYSVVYNDMMFMARSKPAFREFASGWVARTSGRLLTLLLIVLALYVFSGRSPIR
jgi:membrane protein involved in D-alanine export